MEVRRDLATAAITRLGSALNLDPTTTALGILSVVTANMARAIRVISVQRGYDPRDYTLMAFGGAGPLHAARLVQELNIGRVIVPRNPGILCAMGLLLTDMRADFAVTDLRIHADAAIPAMTAAFETLAVRATTWFDTEKISTQDRSIARAVDMRYAGQNYEIPVPLPDGPIGPATVSALRDRFAEAHRRLYGFATPDDPTHLVTFRVEATGRVPKARFTPIPMTGGDPARAVIGQRALWNGTCPLYDRDRLDPGDTLPGPAIVEQMDTTTFIPAGTTARVDEWLNLILEPS